jgi:uncharacterized membrane protein
MNNSLKKLKSAIDQAKDAPGSRNILFLLIFALVFVLVTMAIMSFAFGAFISENFGEVFWVSAFCEVLMAVLAIIVCSLYGTDSSATQRPLLVWVRKLFRN